MTDVLWAVLDAALVHALDLEAEERDAYVASLDPATRNALAPLLRDALADDPLLDHPDVAFAGISEPVPTGKALDGTRVGPYRIEALVGEGGMGRVYRARRDDGVFDQTVALKVVRQALVLAGADVSARLRRERDLLAALDHVGIARLLDGGETEDGVPYLVTEFVDGMAITDHADAHALGVAARVRLLVDVARAVEHAHRRFVVHRDLKPSNVLVAERDGAARPVVLDFGIATLLDAGGETTGAFPPTRTGLRMLTPAYAAPELYDPAVPVTTAADVYGLGALLYELLTGRRPHDDAAPGPPTAEPTRPSKAVTALAHGAAAPTQVASRSRVLRGDLDTICLKALHPDPVRRYASAADLAGDLERYLGGRPVEARRDSAGYVARRFVRRHRVTVTAASVALVALVVGLGASLVSLGHERAARRRATEATELFAGVLQSVDPTADGQPVTLRQALDSGLGRINAVESDDLRAYLLGVLGLTYVKLSEPVRADSLLAASLALYGDAASDSTVSQVRLTYADTRAAANDYATALALGRRVYADQGAPRRPSRLSIIALSSMSRSLTHLGQPREALRYAEQAVVLAREGYPDRLTKSLIYMGMALSEQGLHRDAVRVQQEAVLQASATFGPESFQTSIARSALGETLLSAGRYAEAERALRRAGAYEKRAQGSELGLGYILAEIGSARLHQDREAVAVLDSAVTIGRRQLPPGHPDLWLWLTNLAAAQNGAGAYRDAEATAREALTRAEGASDAAGADLARAQRDRAQRRGAPG